MQVLEQAPQGFNEILFKAVDAALNETVGQSGAKALKFYLDSSLIVKNPDYYSQQLRKIFTGSEAGAQIVEKRITRNLSRLIAEKREPAKSASQPNYQPVSESMSFRDSIEACRSSYLQG